MLLNFLKSKLHRATVTDANLNYTGSITIDQQLLEAANIYENEKVQVVNINNGARFETYVIKGEKNSGVVCVNGAAARLVHPGDKVIIISYCWIDEKELKELKPKIVVLDEKNSIEIIKSEEK